MRLKRFLSNDVFNGSKEEIIVATENALSKIADSTKKLKGNMEFRRANYVDLYFYGNALRIKIYANKSEFKVESNVIKKYLESNIEFEKDLNADIEQFIGKKLSMDYLDSFLQVLPQIESIYKKMSKVNDDIKDKEDERAVECSLMKETTKNDKLFLLDMEISVTRSEEFHTSDKIRNEGDMIAVVKGKSGYRFLPIELKLLSSAKTTREMATEEIKTFLNIIYGCVTNKEGLFDEFKLNYEKIYRYKKNLKLISSDIENIDILDDRKLNFKPIGLILEIDDKKAHFEICEEPNYIIYKLTCSQTAFLQAEWLEKMDI